MIFIDKTYYNIKHHILIYNMTTYVSTHVRVCMAFVASFDATYIMVQ